jgi:hypothetical protein
MRHQAAIRSSGVFGGRQPSDATVQPISADLAAHHLAPAHRAAAAGLGVGQRGSEFRFVRTICGWTSAILSLRDELPTASIGRFVASADRPPPWTTLWC